MSEELIITEGNTRCMIEDGFLRELIKMVENKMADGHPVENDAFEIRVAVAVNEEGKLYLFEQSVTVGEIIPDVETEEIPDNGEAKTVH